jgi:predicted dehydrogenase
MNLSRPAYAGSSSSEKTIRLGFVGIGGRGLYHLSSAAGIVGVEIPALCEIIPERLENAKKVVEDAGLPTPRLYGRGEEDFRRMCQEEELDAVICSTSWKWHAPICLAAMRSNKHAVSEVPLIQTLDEAWEIVETYESTGYWATLGLQPFRSLALLNMIQKGVLGNIVHAESGYMHDLRFVKYDPNEEPWRRLESIHRNGNLYPDHPMSTILPALDINHGDRLDFLVSMSSKGGLIQEYAATYYKDPNHPLTKQEYALGNYNASLMRTVNGKMITLNHDTSTPHPRENIRIQGTKGIYYDGQMYIEGLSPVEHQYEPAAKYMQEYRHPADINFNPPPRRATAKIQGHGGGGQQKTPQIWDRLVNALRENRMPDWDVYDSVTSGAIVPLTEASVANKSRAVDFPDFTKGKWKNSPRITLE